MVKNNGYHRYEALCLNTKTLRASKRLEVAVSEDGIDISKQDRSISTWILSAANNVSVSYNKLGKSPLKKHHGGFILDDPQMNESRFFVEYHRLQNPALRRYFNSIPVRQRLRKLGIVTEENNVISSTKEFAEYLRYLDRIEAIEITETLKNTVRQFLSNSFFVQM